MIDLALERITAFRAEIGRLKESDFPYDEPLKALNLLEADFEKLEQMLRRMRPAAPVNLVNNVCSISLKKLQTYLPLLGFILRSTNVRNAFEAYPPLLRLARRLLGADTQLILSSEWDFIPVIYHSIRALPKYVLIGFPAPESSNPLLIPLAGHELGHSVWKSPENQPIRESFDEKINNGIVHEIITTWWAEYESIYSKEGFTRTDVEQGHKETYKTWALAYAWAFRQVEEMFCDFFGLRLFAESFMNAFAYLTSPGVQEKRFPPFYPERKLRLSHLADAARAKDINVPPGFETGYVGEAQHPDRLMRMLMGLADAVSSSLVGDLIKLAWQIADHKEIPQRDQSQVLEITVEFDSKIVPITRPATLVDLLNAGWKCHQKKNLFPNIPHVREEAISREDKYTRSRRSHAQEHGGE